MAYTKDALSVLDAIDESLTKAGALPLLRGSGEPLAVNVDNLIHVHPVKVESGPRLRRSAPRKARRAKTGATVRRFALVAIAVGAFAVGHKGGILGFAATFGAGVLSAELGLVTGRGRRS